MTQCRNAGCRRCTNSEFTTIHEERKATLSPTSSENKLARTIQASKTGRARCSLFYRKKNTRRNEQIKKVTTFSQFHVQTPDLVTLGWIPRKQTCRKNSSRTVAKLRDEYACHSPRPIRSPAFRDSDWMNRMMRKATGIKVPRNTARYAGKVTRISATGRRGSVASNAVSCIPRLMVVVTGLDATRTCA